MIISVRILKVGQCRNRWLCSVCSPSNRGALENKNLEDKNETIICQTLCRNLRLWITVRIELNTDNSSSF